MRIIFFFSNIYSPLFGVSFFSRKSPSRIVFSGSYLSRSVEQRPMSLRLENEIQWHYKCNRMYLFNIYLVTHTWDWRMRFNDTPNVIGCTSWMLSLLTHTSPHHTIIHITTHTQHTFTHDAARRNYRWYYTTRRWIGGWCWAQTRQPRYPTCSTSIFPPKFARSGTRCVCSKKECVCTNYCNGAIATNDSSGLGIPCSGN